MVKTRIRFCVHGNPHRSAPRTRTKRVAFFATSLSVLRLSPRLNRGVIVKSDTALAATNDDKFASLTDIEVAQTGSKREGRMESFEDFPCNRCEGYFSEYFRDPVSIDNGLFVGGLSKRSKLATASMVSRLTAPLPMYLTPQHSTPQAAEQADESCAEQEQRRRFGRSYRGILDGQEIFTGAHVLARYLCAKIRLIQAETAVHLTHVAVGYVIDGEQARLASTPEGASHRSGYRERAVVNALAQIPSVDRPCARRGEFNQMAVRVTKVEARASQFPRALLFHWNSSRLEPRFPTGQFGRRNTEREVQLTVPS